MTKEEIGRVIRESRIAAGLTQLQVGNALKRPQTTVAAWEAGRSQPDANTLFDLFRVLGRSVDEAFGFHNSTPPLSAQALKLARDYDSLDDGGQQRMIEAMERELAIKASMDKLMASVRVLHIYDHPIDFGHLDDSGINLSCACFDQVPFSIPEKPPKSQAEVFRRLKDDKSNRLIGIRIRLESQQDKIYIVDLGAQAVDGDLGLYNINGRSFIAKVKEGKFFLHPYNRNPVTIQEKPKCDGAVIGTINTKTVYR